MKNPGARTKDLTTSTTWLPDLKALWIDPHRRVLADTIRRKYVGLMTVTCESYLQGWFIHCKDLRSARRILMLCDPEYRRSRGGA